MSNVTVEYISVPRTARNKRIYPGDNAGASTYISGGGGGGGITLPINESDVINLVSDLASLSSAIGGKVDKVTGKSLISDSEITRLASVFNYVISKADVESVLTGNITSHTHSQYITAVTKAMVEAVLTGNITSHTHNQYLTAITKAMVEAVLTGDITTHTHSALSGAIALKNPSGVVKWYMGVDASDNLYFTSTSGFGFTVSQTGNMNVSKEVSAYS